MDFTYSRKSDRDRLRKPRLTGSTSCAPASPQSDLPAGDVVRAYKNLEQAERAFGSLKGPDLQIRPIHHHLENRVRAHVLICMLAYYLTWHLKAAWKPMLFTDEHRPVSPDPVAKAVRSTRRASTKRKRNGPPTGEPGPQLPHAPARALDPDPEHHPPAGRTDTFEKLTQPTALQAQRTRTRRHRPRRGHQVDTTGTRQTASNPNETRRSRCFTRRNFGLGRECVGAG